MRSLLAFVVGVSVVGGVLAACLTLSGMQKIDPPEIEAVPARQRVAANPRSERIIANYHLINNGRNTVMLKGVTTTCGCSVAEIDFKSLKPGERGIIKVEGTPPAAGEKAVKILVDTDVRRVVLELIMVSSLSPPFVELHSGPVRFGELLTGTESELIQVDTREPVGSEPLIREVVSTLPDLSVTGGLLLEREADGILFRRYRYEAQLRKLPPPGQIVGELLFWPHTRGSEPELRLPVLGTVRPPVYAAPPTLYATFGSTDPAPELTVKLVANDPGFFLAAKPSDDTAQLLDIEIVPEDEKTYVQFRIKPRETADTTRAVATFETNHPDMSTIKVPINYRFTN